MAREVRISARCANVSWRDNSEKAMVTTSENLIILVLVAAIAVLIGVLLGVGLSGVFEFWERKRSEGGLNRELFRVWRGSVAQSLNLEINGKVYADVEPLSVGEFRELLGYIRELLAWLGIRSGDMLAEMPDSAQAAILGDRAGTEIAMETDQSVLPGDEVYSPTSSIAIGESSASEPPLGSLQQEETDRDKVKPVGIFRTMLGFGVKKKSTAVVPPMSLSEQINEILQEKLGAANLDDRKIYLLEEPERGVVVVIGEDEYEGVEQVPDEQIKTLIQESVGEWESRSGNNPW